MGDAVSVEICKKRSWNRGPFSNLGLGWTLVTMIRIAQITHLFLIVATVGLYAWLMVILPTDDPWRVRISGGIAISLAIWSAVVFVEALRSENDDFKKRCLAAYRQLLNRVPTLVASTAILGVVAGWLVFVGAGYGQVEFSSQADRDVFVFLSNPGKEPERIILVPAGKRVASRLPIGRQWIYFATVQEKQIPYHTGKVDVLSMWRGHRPQEITVPEVPKYVGQ